MAKMVYQLKVWVQNIEPLIWRRIQVPSTYDFWQLHSTLQDAFGWTNSHLFSFTYTDSFSDDPIILGNPLEPDLRDEIHDPDGWKHKINRYITGETSKIEYTYDFGDNWQHTIILEEILPYEKGVKYPRCIDGERNSPPEDCGGPHGYAGLLEVLFDPSDPEHDYTVAWVDSMKGCTFHPEEFDPSKVKFAKPGWRLNKLFDDD